MNGKRIQMVFATPDPKWGGGTFSRLQEQEFSGLFPAFKYGLFYYCGKKMKICFWQYRTLLQCSHVDGILHANRCVCWTSKCNFSSSHFPMRISFQGGLELFSTHMPQNLFFPHFIPVLQWIAKGITLLTTGSLHCMQKVCMNSSPLLFLWKGIASRYSAVSGF